MQKFIEIIKLIIKKSIHLFKSIITNPEILDFKPEEIDTSVSITKSVPDKTKQKYDPDKVYCIYEAKVKDSNERWGVMHFRGQECKFISGRYGNGEAPVGNWKSDKLIKYNLQQTPDREKMAQFGISWQIPFYTPNTGRDCIAIHPDGNVEGTLGCIGLHFENADHAVRIYNVFRDWFETHKSVEVVVK